MPSDSNILAGLFGAIGNKLGADPNIEELIKREMLARSAAAREAEADQARLMNTSAANAIMGGESTPAQKIAALKYGLPGNKAGNVMLEQPAPFSPAPAQMEQAVNDQREAKIALSAPSARRITEQGRLTRLVNATKDTGLTDLRAGLAAQVDDIASQLKMYEGDIILSSQNPEIIANLRNELKDAQNAHAVVIARLAKKAGVTMPGAAPSVAPLPVVNPTGGKGKSFTDFLNENTTGK